MVLLGSRAPNEIAKNAIMRIPTSQPLVLVRARARKPYHFRARVIRRAASRGDAYAKCLERRHKTIQIGGLKRSTDMHSSNRRIIDDYLPPVVSIELGDRLRKLGIRAQPGRRAALTHLAAQLPAAVIANLLGIHPTTAVHWVHDAGGDWNRYAAQLTQDASHQP